MRMPGVQIYHSLVPRAYPDIMQGQIFLEGLGTRLKSFAVGGVNFVQARCTNLS